MALNISILQWNCRGINNKIDDLINSFENIPDVLVLQETNLIKYKYFSIKGYETILRFGERKDKKQGNGKGLIIAIKDNHTGWIKQKIDNENAQLLTAEIYINNKIIFYNPLCNSYSYIIIYCIPPKVIMCIKISEDEMIFFSFIY